MTLSKLIVGIDEVGRGPWAGPVVAGAVMFPLGFCKDDVAVLAGATDSKKLTAAKREALNEVIWAHGLVALGQASVAEIDALNIRQATLLAMRRAVEKLVVESGKTPDFSYVDGRDVPEGLPCAGEAVIKGDSKVFEVACASIVAKVARDRMMVRLHETFPHYGWNSNAGYGTAVHQAGLASHGVTEHHRRSFAPVRAILAQKVAA